MGRSALVLLGLGLLLNAGGWLSRHAPDWLDEDPLEHPFGLDPTGHSSTVAGAIPDHPQLPPVDPGHPLDLNAADALELQRLPGVGPVLAARIAARRDSLGRFRSIEELDAVSGIGPKLLAKLLPLVRLAPSVADSVRDL